MNLKNFIKSTSSSNSILLYQKNSQFLHNLKKKHSISSNNLNEIYNKLPQKENIKINNQSTIAVIRKRILNSKNIYSYPNLNTKKNKNNKKATKIEVNKKQNNQNKKPLLKPRKSFNEYQINNLKKSFSKNLNIDTKNLDRRVNINSKIAHKPIIKYNSNKQFNKTVYQTYSNSENKGKTPISLKNKNILNNRSNNYIFSNQEKNKKLKTNKNSKRPLQVLNLKKNSLEMEKIFYKKNDLFSNTTYNIYNVNTPIYNLISFPSINNNKKQPSSPRYINDFSNLSTDKNVNKKEINLNCLIDSDIENERSQLVSKDLNMTEKDFKKNMKINNSSFSSTINYRNNKFIHSYGNIGNDKINFFKSTNGLKTTKNENKEVNIINTINNHNRKSINKKSNKKRAIGLKKYLTYFPGNKPKIDKKNLHNKQQSVSILGQNNNKLLKDSVTLDKNKINKRVMKINSCTLAGYTSPGMQKINQDNFFIKKDFLEPEQFFIGICDGHGIQGHLISEYVSKTLPSCLNDINGQSIKNAYLSIHSSLQNDNSKIDSTLSGTTCTSIIVSQNKVICANVGDSRAILSRYENGVYNSINLSRDHKPTETDEMKRILLNGGRIKQFYDEKLKEYIGPERIWLKNSEIPGLAMSRSIGDTIAHSVGVISEPEIIKVDFVGSEKFIVIASDGIWEYIDSDECVKIIKDFYENNMDAVGGLNALVKEAFKRWKIEEDNIDDITAIVLFFE